MQTTIKYYITTLESVTLKNSNQNATLVKAKNENSQAIELINFDLPSMRLGDELEITVRNNEQSKKISHAKNPYK